MIGLGYDVQGNLENKNGQGYAFDYGNRLRRVLGKEIYRYDALGRRVQSVRDDWSTTNRLSMYNKAGQMIYTEAGSPKKALEHIYLGSSLLAIRETDWAGTPAVVRYQHTDALGSPAAVTDATGAVVERTDWEPYGAAVGKPAYDGVGFTGHVMDGGSELTYMQQRYYDSGIGTFLSVDPIAPGANSGAEFNRYRYAKNSPYRFTDPDGRLSWDQIAGAWGWLNGSLRDDEMNACFPHGCSREQMTGLRNDERNRENTKVLIGAAGAVDVASARGAVLLVREASLLKRTAEGATRIGAASLRGGALTRKEIAFTRTVGTEFTQSNGARAFVVKTADGKFNVAFFGDNGYITSMRNVSQKKLLKQMEKYEWRVSK